MTIDTRPRRARLSDVAPADLPRPLRQVGPAEVRVVMPAGTVVRDLSDLPLQRLVIVLAAAVERMASVLGSSAVLPETVVHYVYALRQFVGYLADRGAAPGLSPADLPGDAIDDFEAWMRERYRPGSQVPYTHTCSVIGMLRVLAAEGMLAPALAERSQHGPRGRKAAKTPIDAYDERTAAAIRSACRREIATIIRRIEEGERLLNEAVDHESAADRDQTVGDALRVIVNGAIPAVSDAPRLRAGHLGELRRQVFPMVDDIAPFLVLLSLESGIEATSNIELRADCLTVTVNGRAQLSYLKRRSHGKSHKRMPVADAGISTPGGIIRAYLRVSRNARLTAPDPGALWIHARLTPRGPNPIGCPASSGTLAAIGRFAVRHALVDSDGRPVNLQLRRLRKTHKAAAYLASNGVLEDFAQGHTVMVAGDHYADIPALRHVHEAAAADGISAALEAALGYAGEPVVVSTDDESLLASGDLAVARRLGLDDDDISALASGENDTWLGSCRDFDHSPFAKAGSPCPVPFTGCLLCANAVITRRKLPALLALKRRLEADADLTDQHVWVERWGATYVRIEQIIDRYPADEVTAADAISLATDDAPLQIPALLGIAP